MTSHTRPTPSRRVALPLAFLCTVVCLATFGAGQGFAHPHVSPPPIDLKLHILDDAFKITVIIEKRLWREVAPVPEDGSLWDIQRFAQWFAESCEVRVDGNIVPFAGKSMKRLIQLLDPGGKASPPSAIASLRAPHSGPLPRKLTIQWKDFDHIMWEDKVEVPVIVERGITEGSAALLTPDEPGLAWHSAAHIERPRPELAAVAQPAPRPRKRGWRFPMSALLVALAGLGWAAMSRGTGVRIGIALAGIGGAVLLGNLGSVEIGGESGTRVAKAQAVEIFERLHQNIYTAFEVEDEDEIFDRLSVSAKGKVLADLYTEVFESLVLRDQAGAVASVESVETTKRDVTIDPKNPDEFRAHWGWSMIGRVAHWGHIHRRKNIYEADYVVQKHGDAWYITDIKVLERARESLDPPTPAPGDGGPIPTPGDEGLDKGPR